MPAESQPLPLAADFPPATRDQWRSLAAKVLEKSGVSGDPEQALTTQRFDGDVRPLYTAEDAPRHPTGVPGLAPFVRGATADAATVSGWDVRQRHCGPDAAAVNAAVLDDLEHGATSVWLCGLAPADLERALDGVHLDLAPIVLDAGAGTGEAAAALLQLARRRGTDPGELAGSFGADPIGLRARTGADAGLALLGDLAEQAAAAPRLRLSTVNGTVYHDAGASDAQEVGIGTAVGVAYLRALTAAGLGVDEALGRIEFRFAVSDDQFAGIAKLRAARQLWARVAELSGAATQTRGQYQHAVTSAAMLTRRDPWVNMLRTAIGCFAGAIGGADAITVLPFDAAIGRSDDFARRIARNTQSILHDESSLARVVDAAGGSWFVESLTAQLADAAWAQFTAIERAGGALAALDSGLLAEAIGGARSARAEAVAHRRAPITGVSEFAFLEEQPVSRPAVADDAPAGPLPAHRWAEGYEALRDRAERAPSPPTVFLAALGPRSAHAARVGFAANLFAAGGVSSVEGTGELDDIVAAFRQSGSPLAVLCSSDKVYTECAQQAAAALREAGAKQVWLAGKAETPGVDERIFVGVDALAALRTTFDVLELPA